MKKTTLVSLLHKAKNTVVYFGPQGFLIAATVDELDAYQQGFSVNPDGSELSASEKAGWKESWVVVARDTELGDPYFVDTSESALPVYTAMRGETEWMSELVASSLDGFLACLALLGEKNHQTSAQFVPDGTTLVDSELLAKMERELVAASACDKFWAEFFECYIDWLDDDEF